MLSGCKNCGGYFTVAEVQRLRRPVHAWRLTSSGEHALAANVALDVSKLCPRCGNNTLAPATAPPVAHG